MLDMTLNELHEYREELLDAIEHDSEFESSAHVNKLKAKLVEVRAAIDRKEKARA